MGSGNRETASHFHSTLTRPHAVRQVALTVSRTHSPVTPEHTPGVKFNVTLGRHSSFLHVMSHEHYNNINTNSEIPFSFNRGQSYWVQICHLSLLFHLF